METLELLIGMLAAIAVVVTLAGRTPAGHLPTPGARVVVARARRAAVDQPGERDLIR
jgi:hypothetical protein